MTTLLTDELADSLAGAVRRGVPLETASIAAGVNKHAITDWLEAASGRWRNGASVSQEFKERLVTFTEKIRRAQAEFEAEQVEAIAEAGAAVGRNGIPEWRARAWLLNNHPRTRATYHEVKQVQQDVSGKVLHEHSAVRELASNGGLPALEAAYEQLVEQHPELTT